jgi:hypothetical protein
MPIVPFNLPPGFYRNGTPYTRKGRVEKGSLVRYHDGSYRPVGGWLRRRDNTNAEISALISDATEEAIRDIFAWRDNSEDLNVVFGSNLAVYHMDKDGTTTEITPTGYTALNNSKDPQTDSGYGGGAYGVGAFGVSVELTGADIIPPDRWYFDTFGEILLYGSIRNGDIYELDLSDLSESSVTNAPSNNADMCVTEERQVFVVGANGEPRRVRASEVEDRTVWTAATDNQAIDRTLPGNGKLLRCLPVLNDVLILGENDANVARYIGPPYVYSIEEVGTDCGPLAAQAVAKSSNFAVWWGSRNFWIYTGTVQPLNCDVIDFLYSDIDPKNVSKICTFTITDFSEVWWLYQSKSTTTTEVDSYVTWDYRRNVWTTGRLSRTSGIDKGSISTPLMVNPDGEIFNHEIAGVFPLNEGDVFLETGPLDFNNGERNIALRYVYPDQENIGGIEYTFYGRQFPTATEYSYGPYTSRNPTPTRAFGRSLRMRADFVSYQCELGLARFDVQIQGTGKR